MPIPARTRKPFTPAPEGVHAAVCCDVIDKGEVEKTFQGKTRKVYVVQFRWQIEERNPEDDRRFLVIASYTNSLDKKANLRKTLKSWLGRDLTKQELGEVNGNDPIDLETMIGKTCVLNIAHNEGSDGNTYANVAAIMPLPKGMTKLEVEDYERRDGGSPSGTQADDSGAGDEDIPF